MKALVKATMQNSGKRSRCLDAIKLDSWDVNISLLIIFPL